MAENSHIEEFFKKQLASHEFTFREEDWHKMESKLELSLPSHGILPAHIPVRIILIILAALTAAFILGWLASELVGNKNNTTEEVGKPASLIVPGLTASAGKNIKPAKETGGRAAIVSNSDINELPAPLNYPVTVLKPDSVSGDLIALLDEEYVIPSEGPLIDEFYPGEASDTYKEFQLHPYPVTLHHIPLDYSKELPGFFNDNPDQQKLLPRSFSRWSIGLLIAPDFNSTGVLHRKTMSPAVGGIISYNFSPRWALSARILYNNKKYRSNAEYYNVPDEYWKYSTNGMVPDVIDGSCRVLDVPLLVTYRFYQSRSLSLTISAGPGSYFLFDEKYEFSFNQVNPGTNTEWRTKDNSEVLFGVANLALGLSLQTSQKTSFTVEPYLKLPLKPMGWANVNLSGMGLSFSMRYHFH